jgi:hypothetical protein
LYYAWLFTVPGKFTLSVVNDLKPNSLIQSVGSRHVAPDQQQADPVKSAVQQVAGDVMRCFLGGSLAVH